MSSNVWDASAEDFGQKVDLTVRIREILRNYPEGLSILKELIQNADDAGARIVRFCTADPRQTTTQSNDALSELMKGPSLISYNSAKFTDTDFKSIQRIGDSLKKDKNGTKTGRFGVGVNSTYHLTDVPMFASGSKVVMFDPQASFVPGINPANPGKMIDCSKANGRNLVQSLPQVFDPLKIFGCQLSGDEFDGTIFRFALRTETQAQVSRLSRQSHSLSATRNLLKEMASAAPGMLLFLKNVECIEIYDWKACDASPVIISKTNIGNASDKLRMKRSYVLNAPSRVPSQPQPVDYILDLQSTAVGSSENTTRNERWMVCNQLGGGNASKMASDTTLSHMKLVPWAGVAARLSPCCDVASGNAYCFLPLPVRNQLPVHVNGYFELSSNRRDVWWGDDMAGDGRARAEWNRNIVQDIAAPCYIRLLTTAIRTKLVTNETYECLFPQKDLSGAWKVLGDTFLKGVKEYPVLYSHCAAPDHWVAPSKSLVLHDDKDQKLSNILSMDRLPLVLFRNADLKSALLRQGTCAFQTTPEFLRRYFSARKSKTNGCLEVSEKLDHAEYLLTYCKSDLSPLQYESLSGCQFIPLASGNLGRLCKLPAYEHSSLSQLQVMGFSKLLCIHALRISKNNVDTAMEWLLENRYSDGAVEVQHGIDPYLVCNEDSASLLRKSAADSFIDLEMINDPGLRKFFGSGAVSATLNILPSNADMLADIVARAIPAEWRGKDSAPWNPRREHPNVQWFVDLWRFICSCNDVGGSLKAVAEQFCIVPTNQGVVCSLSAGNSIISANRLDNEIVECLARVGVRILFPNILPSDLVVPPEIYSYVFDPTRDGVIKAIDAASRRQNPGTGTLENVADEIKHKLLHFLVRREHDKLSTPCKVMLRNFPIFSAYTNEQNAETQFVAMARARLWYVLEGTSKDESVFMTSDFLVASNPLEMKLLTDLGAKQMSRKDFYKNVVIPSVDRVDADVCNAVIKRMLLDIPSLCEDDHQFRDYLSSAKFIRSSDSKSFRAPSDLYDPEVPQLLTLMDQDSFPDEYYMDPDLLLSLRKVGLQSILSWNTIIDCARSIESEGAQGDEQSALSAKARGSELLLFLDMHVDTFFPEFKKKSQMSKTGRLFRKMNSALFDDPEKKKREKELRAQRIQDLLTIQWMPVHMKPLQSFLPWPERRMAVAAPSDTVTSDKMWLASFSKRLVDGDVHSPDLRKLFGWMDDIAIKDVSLQLRMMSKTFDTIKREIEQNEKVDGKEDESKEDDASLRKKSVLSDICQKYSSEVGRMYHILNNIESEYEMDVIQSVLHGSAWLWMGDGFVSSDHIAYSSSINAQPYLFTVPPDLACFRNLLSAFSIRHTFGSSDYCMVLSRMGQETEGRQLGVKEVELAVNLVQKISDDVLRLTDFEIFAPTQNGDIQAAGKLVYDDAPWLSKDLPGKKGLVYAHPKLSASVCEKIGVKSVRKLLLQHNADMISFGSGVVHEAFGQSESLTRRLKNIVEMYPEGTQQLSELIQNADDAKASVVKFVISLKQHGTSSLLGQKMSEWQGGALYCFNDATFSARDFQNLSKIGQASKLEKLVTTGRFGLGFNSVFHWTDVPSIVSGDHLVMFDPHAKYVPGSTDNSRGIKIRFTHTELASQFPDQMAPYFLFGNDMKQRFTGTLFRFPFRNETTAAESEISKKQYGKEEVVKELVDNFKKVASKTLLFLRHVRRVEFYFEHEDDEEPKLQYYADVADRKVVSEPRAQNQMAGFDSIRSLASNAVFGATQSNNWNSISDFIAGDEQQPMSKEAFYSKLLRMPENLLPKTNHVVTINFVDRAKADVETAEIEDGIHNDRYLICSALGGGQCRAMACNPEHRDLKFLPWASVAAHLSRNGNAPPNEKGNAFCFLPLPSETGFAVHVNGYFELSANRRDIWHGDDMTGAGHTRSEWNRLLLQDVISPLYTEVLLSARSLLGPGDEFKRLWPTKISSDIWKVVRSRVYHLAENLPLMHTTRLGGKWVSMNSAVFLEESSEDDERIGGRKIMSKTKKKLLDILLQENLNVVTLSSSIIKCMKEEACLVNEVSPSFVREWFKKALNHPSLCDRENAVFLLRYCTDDLSEDKRKLQQLYGLPILPLANGGLGEISDPSADAPSTNYFIVDQQEKFLLEKASDHVVDVWTSDTRLNTFLMNKDFHVQTNVSRLDVVNFVRLLSNSFPSEWAGLPEIHWVIDSNSKEASPTNPLWISRLWDYIASDKGFSDDYLPLLLGNMQIIPTLVGDEDRTLQVLLEDMAVVDVTNPQTGEVANEDIAKILRNIGLRTLDVTVFQGKDKPSIFRVLKRYVQPPTVRGIITALKNSFPGQLSNDEIVDKLSARFKYVDNFERKVLRNYLRDFVDKDLQTDEVKMLRALPIFEVFNLGDKEVFSHLLGNDAFIPPSCASRYHLDQRFVKANSREDTEFFSKIDLSTMSPQDYYASYAPSLLSQGRLDEDNRSTLISKMLQDSLRLSEEENGTEYISRLSSIKFVPNIRGHLVRANELYDPQEAGLAYLVDESMLPAKKLHSATLLQSLRILGMSSSLSIDGVLESARQIELQAKNLSLGDTVEERDVDAIRKRAGALLNFLDDEDNIHRFASERTESFAERREGEHDVNDSSEDIELSLPDDNADAVEELMSIAWLPVDRFDEQFSNETKPPRRRHQLSLIGISAPKMTRTKSDEWICSSSLDILSINVKCDALIRLFKWDEPPCIDVVASQLVALSQISNSNFESQAYKQQCSRVTSQIYEILDQHMNSADADADEVEDLLAIFHKKPWIWVGDRFVATSQVAFNAPEHAKPYLYNVPDQMICYETLLKACGVRESFSGEDYIGLLWSLSCQLQGRACDPKQLDLAVFVARNLSRIPAEDLSSLDKSNLHLPSVDGKMFKASDMTYDDAPWLSAIVKKARHVFVHPDVGNEVARILGSKSLRDVLSANQNGMVKIPCPKHDALQQLLKQRVIDSWECCRSVLEIIEIAELKGAKQISIMMDHRSHGTMSLLHPCLAQAQGPALVICFHDVSMEVDEVVRLTSPSKYYSSTISGDGGAGGSGFPRYGRGLCGAFTMTDCLQILTGRSLLIFDPSGHYLVEDKLESSENDGGANMATPIQESKKVKANARNYGLSHSFCNQFPDQFEPFFSLHAGVEESLINGQSSTSGPFFRGTIVRLPLRKNDSQVFSVCNKEFCDTDYEQISSLFIEAVPRTMLFTYHLQSVSFDEWLPGENQQNSIVSCRVSSSPLSRRIHLEEQADEQSWRKEKSKLGKLFKSSWVPRRGSHILQLSSRRKDEKADVVDSYAIYSVLAPPRLREMACTDSLKPLNLIPTVSIAAHLDRSIGSVSQTKDYTPPEGRIFVGFDTGIKTGLPFCVNAPIFLHEWLGTVLLQPDDDIDFKTTFPGIRDIVIRDKYNDAKARTLALHVWNRQAVTSAIKELVPPMLKEIKEPLQHMWSRNPRLYYKFWPYRNRILPHFKDLVDSSLYSALAAKSMDVYLTDRDGFQSIEKGCFASPEFQLDNAANFFLQHMSLFTTPRLVVDDLVYYGIGVRTLTPSVARSFLKSDKYSLELSKRPKDALAVLQYCLADLVGGDASTISTCRSDLSGLSILPLADGKIGKVGDQIILANAEQQAMLPMLKHKFLSLEALKILEPLLSQRDFLDVLGLEEFGPKVLAKNIHQVLPPHWEGMDFVKWDSENSSVPNKMWIFQFWKEVSFSNHDEVQLFKRWPLIPTTVGELASCGNARFILYICPDAISQGLQSSLLNSYKLVQEKAEVANRRSAALLAAEMRSPRASLSDDEISQDFWRMGEEKEVEAEDNHISDGATEDLAEDNDSVQNISSGDDESADEDDDGISISETGGSVDIGTEAHVALPEDSHSLGYDPNGESLKLLFSILLKVRCPLLDGSYFEEQDLKKALPSDRLGVSRAIMSTLNQCMNYWSSLSGAPAGENRLLWSNLHADDFDAMLSLLSSHDGSRLSLMISDLSTMKNLPIFQTFAGSRISIQDRDTNFTIDGSVDSRSITSYLPLSLQSKLLADKPQFKDLYEDLNVQVLNEATILQKFVLPEFPNMPIAQKEAVIRNILDKWEILRLSDDLLAVLKETAFVKRTQRHGHGEVVFVKPSQLYDPRNNLLQAIFDKDRSLFPAEEFGVPTALDILESVGLQTKVDKDTFLKCAWIVEEEQDVKKAALLFEHFAEHFGDFYDGNQEFTRNIAEIRCVPGEADGEVALYRFRETAAPKDRFLSFKVMPVMLETCTPPQILFSALGVVSPPPISAVLKQIRALTEVEGSLEHWTYKYGTIDQVFSALFSFLQDNFSDLSPRIKEALSERPIVPIGSHFVKASKLFFRLAKDLAPFFYEVPRAFGAYDVLLRQLGVRESPKSGDYAKSLLELNKEIGAVKLNANELNSVIEVVNLAASDKEQSLNPPSDEIYAPNQSGKLIRVIDLMQNDRPWLIHSGRIDVTLIHLVHPKVTKEICDKLQIKCLSTKVVEILDKNFVPREIGTSPSHAGLNTMMKSDIFADIVQSLVPRKMTNKAVNISLRNLHIVAVESIQTRFITVDYRGNFTADITNPVAGSRPPCYVDGDRVLLTRLPVGVSQELAVAAALCDKFNIQREHVAGLTAILGSQASRIAEIKMMTGLFEDGNNDELHRGTPGHPLVPTDLNLVEIKPLKMFKHGEIVAIRQSNDSSQLVYGTVSETQDSSSISRLRVYVADGVEETFLSSQVYSLKGGSREQEAQSNTAAQNVEVFRGEHPILEPLNNENDMFENKSDQNQQQMGHIRRDEVLTAVQDLLQSADLSLKDDAKNMMHSNLSLKDQLSKKMNELECLEKKTKSLSDNVSKGIESFLCPITRETMEDPVICCDGHTYEREAIEMWLRNNSRSPKTNQQLPSNELVPNYALKSAIEAMAALSDSLRNL